MEEKRKYPRIKVNVPVSYDCFDDDEELFEQKLGTILDVSEGGLLIESDSLIDANYVKIVVVGFDNKIYSIVASTVHSRKLEQGIVRTGFCFHGDSSESIKFVSMVIRTHHYSRKAS